MPDDPIEDVEIIEPPLSELGKGGSGFKRGCFVGCASVIFLIVLLIGGVRLILGKGPQIISTLPSNFPTSIPVYDKDAIERITLVRGAYKARAVLLASFIPKLFLSPLLFSPLEPAPTSTLTEKETTNDFLEALDPALHADSDSVQIEWRNIAAEPAFVISFYTHELKKNGYTIDGESSAELTKQFSFSHTNGITGSLYTKDLSTKTRGTNYAMLSITFPHHNTTSTR